MGKWRSRRRSKSGIDEGRSCGKRGGGVVKMFGKLGRGRRKGLFGEILTGRRRQRRRLDRVGEGLMVWMRRMHQVLSVGPNRMKTNWDRFE